jgi:hypothetical protein
MERFTTSDFLRFPPFGRIRFPPHPHTIHRSGIFKWSNTEPPSTATLYFVAKYNFYFTNVATRAAVKVLRWLF